MSDPETHDPADTPAPEARVEAGAPPPSVLAAEAAAPPPAPRRRGRWRGLLAAVLFLVLFAAVGWLAVQQQQMAQAKPPPSVSPEQLAQLSQRVDALSQQIDQVRRIAQQKEAPPAPPPSVDLAPLDARIAALEHQVQAVEAAAATPASSSSAPAAPAPPAPDLGPIEQKLDNVAAEAQQATAAQAALGSKLADLQQQLAAAQAKAGQLAGKANSAERLAQTRVALDDGLPLGTIPDAPPALAKFATEPPPTQAALRLSFPQAAAAAVHASEPGSSGKSLGERMWLRAESLVTVKQGDKVLVGSPTAEVLGAAQARLDAGDLAGTLKELDRLDGPATQAMAQWRSQAQALLDARAALDQMARS